MPDLDSSTTTTSTGQSVAQEVPRHEKIRFRRDEITDLGALPSAAGQELQHPRNSGWRRAGHCLLAAVAVLGSLVLLAIIAIEAVSYSGIGQDRLRREAERAIEQMAGVDVVVSMGQARLALDGLRLVAVEVPDVKLTRSDGTPMVEAGLMRFGIRLLPLLSGDVTLGDAKISDARFVVDAMPETGGGDWSEVLRNQNGLFDPQKLLRETFRGVHRGFDALRFDGMRQIAWSNVDFVLPAGGEVKVVRVVHAAVSKTLAGELLIDASFDVDGREVELAASATRDETASRIATLDATVSMDDPHAGQSDLPPSKASRIGSADLIITGHEGPRGDGSELIDRTGCHQQVDSRPRAAGTAGRRRVSRRQVGRRPGQARHPPAAGDHRPLELRFQRCRRATPADWRCRRQSGLSLRADEPGVASGADRVARAGAELHRPRRR